MIERARRAFTSKTSFSSAKKCGHLGGKVVVPTLEFTRNSWQHALRADVCGCRLLIARTDANSAGLLLSDADARDRDTFYGERTPEGFYQFRAGSTPLSARGLAYAPYADMLGARPPLRIWPKRRNSPTPSHAKFPGKLLAYQLLPSFHWKKKLDDVTIANFQQELGKMGYKSSS